MATRRETWHSALDAQMGLWRFTRSDQGQEWLRRHYQTTAESLSEHTVETMLQPLYASEARRILSGDPIFVSAEMCQLIASAADSFQPEPLYVTDLLTPAGFVYYEEPFVVPDRFNRPVEIAAVSWSPVINRRSDSDEELADFGSKAEFLTWLHARDGNRAELGVAADGIVISLYAPTPEGIGYSTPLLLLHMTHWWFGMEFDGNEVDENGVPTGAAWWWKIIQSTLRLMQQRIAVTHTEKAPRPMRREAQRLNYRLGDVLVVRLRRERGQVNEPSGEEARYSHRFIVHGFWRNQWYPVDKIHRQIFISDYVKGPKDKPLIVRPRRAFTWDR